MCVGSFIKKLTGLYPAKFMKQHQSGMVDGKPKAAWVETIGGYPEFISERVYAKIRRDETKFSGDCPTVPQLGRLFAEEMNSYNHSKREAMVVSRKIESERLEHSKQKSIQGIPQGFGKRQPEVNKIYQKLGEPVLREAESIKKNEGGYAYAKFMFQAMGNEDLGAMVGKTVGSNFA